MRMVLYGGEWKNSTKNGQMETEENAMTLH